MAVTERTYTAKNIAAAVRRIEGAAECEAHELVPGCDISRHFREAARLLLAAAANQIPASERNDIVPAINAIHDYLRVTCPVDPESRAEDLVRLRRIFRDLILLARIVANDIDRMDSYWCPEDDWSDVAGHLAVLSAEEPADAYEYDLSRFQHEGMTE